MRDARGRNQRDIQRKPAHKGAGVDPGDPTRDEGHVPRVCRRVPSRAPDNGIHAVRACVLRLVSFCLAQYATFAAPHYLK